MYCLPVQCLCPILHVLFCESNERLWSPSTRITFYLSQSVLIKCISSLSGSPTSPPSSRATRWFPCTQRTTRARWAPSALRPGAPAPSCPSPGPTSRSAHETRDASLTKQLKMFHKVWSQKARRTRDMKYTKNEAKEHWQRGGGEIFGCNNKLESWRCFPLGDRLSSIMWPRLAKA